MSFPAGLLLAVCLCLSYHRVEAGVNCPTGEMVCTAVVTPVVVTTTNPGTSTSTTSTGTTVTSVQATAAEANPEKRRRLLDGTSAGNCYNPNTQFCTPGGAVCSKSMCACGNTALATCISSSDGCTSSGVPVPNKPSDRSGAICPASSSGDPLMKGFDGCQWYFNGAAGGVYTLVASADDTANTLLVPANLKDPNHDGNGTYHGSLSFRHGEHIVEANVSAEGNLTVSVDGNIQPFSSSFNAGAMQGQVHRYMPYYGQYLQVSTPSFTYGVHAVQPAVGEYGFERGHADLDMTVKRAVPGLHGLIGQSLASVVEPRCTDDFTFPGEGTEEDYVVPSLASIPARTKPTLTATIATEDSTRRLLQLANIGNSDASSVLFPLSAHITS